MGVGGNTHPFFNFRNMIIFKAKTNITLIAYITPKHYEYISFDVKSDGTSAFYCKNTTLAKALFKTDEYKNGIITSNVKPNELTTGNLVNVGENAQEDVNEDKDVTLKDVAEDKTRDGGKESVTFSDLAEAVAFLVEKGCKKSELRSTKAVKEKGEELGYDILIEE